MKRVGRTGNLLFRNYLHFQTGHQIPHSFIFNINIPLVKDHLQFKTIFWLKGWLYNVGTTTHVCSWYMQDTTIELNDPVLVY